MRAYLFVAFSCALFLGITAYVAFFLHPLPVKPPSADSFEWKLQQAINTADTLSLRSMTGQDAELALPDGATVKGRQPFVGHLGRFINQQNPANFEWWEFKDSLAIGNLEGPRSTYRMEFIIRSGKLEQLRCRRS